jgi:glutathione S-transferase
MSDNTLKITRTFAAPREQVFNAFTRKEAIQGWFGPEGFSVPAVSVDARPGGRYRIEMHSPQGSVHIVTGEYREVRPPERLVFTWRWLDGVGLGPETLVTLDFAARAGGTAVTLVHSGFATAEARDNHQGGWTSSFVTLTDLLAGKPKSSIPRPTLLGDPRSTYTRSARMVFHEKGISYTLDPQPPHSEAVNAIHPFGKIPALRIGDLALFETSAIMRYVDEAFDGPALMPSMPADRARVEQWISAFNFYFYDAMAIRYVLQYIFPRGADGKPDRATIDKALADMKRYFALLDTAYGGREFIVDDRLSLADLLLAPLFAYVGKMPEGGELIASFRNLSRGQAVIAERESFRATQPQLN